MDIILGVAISFIVSLSIGLIVSLGRKSVLGRRSLELAPEQFMIVLEGDLIHVERLRSRIYEIKYTYEGQECPRQQLEQHYKALRTTNNLLHKSLVTLGEQVT